MKKLQTALFFTLLFYTASAQKIYFVYIQSDPAIPFYVKLNQKTLSSTPAGYLILPKLRDSSYTISVGFPQRNIPEQFFTVSVNSSDHGYLLKNNPEKGWALHDLLSSNVMLASNARPNNDKSSSSKSFTDVLASATDDPSLRDKPVAVKKDEVKPVTENKTEQKVTIIPEIKSENKETVKSDVASNETKTGNKTVIQDPVQVTEEKKPVKTEPDNRTAVTERYKISQVRKYAESSTTEGFGIVYIDKHETGVSDTIRIVIPNPKPVVTAVKEDTREDKKFLDISTVPVTNKNNPTTSQPVSSEKVPVAKTETVTKSLVNNCPDQALEDDFISLRKKMAGEKEEEMLAEARKAFKSKCFTTNQVRVLGSLFETDEARYNFFDMAYKHVSNPEAYPMLQKEFQDSYYSGRFKAMLRN